MRSFSNKMIDTDTMSILSVLPNELIQFIFAFLPLKDHMRMSFVSKECQASVDIYNVLTKINRVEPEHARPLLVYLRKTVMRTSHQQLSPSSLGVIIHALTTDDIYTIKQDSLERAINDPRIQRLDLLCESCRLILTVLSSSDDKSKAMAKRLSERHLIINLPQAKLEDDALLALCKTNLRGANLSGVDLSSIDLSHADLTMAKLHKTNLMSANLSETILHKADLYKANLSIANLAKIDLSSANLSGANLKLRLSSMHCHLDGTRFLSSSCCQSHTLHACLDTLYEMIKNAHTDTRLAFEQAIAEDILRVFHEVVKMDGDRDGLAFLDAAISHDIFKHKEKSLKTKIIHGLFDRFIHKEKAPAPWPIDRLMAERDAYEEKKILQRAYAL
jgi:hypothetical protein